MKTSVATILAVALVLTGSVLGGFCATCRPFQKKDEDQKKKE